MSNVRVSTMVLGAIFAAGSCAAQDAASIEAVSPVAEVSPWSWFGDVMLRGNRTDDIPRLVDPSFSALFARGRFGVAWDPVPTLEFGAAIKLAASSSDNADDRLRNVNERSNDVSVDRLYVRWKPGENASILAGKSAFPLQLSPLLWDADLRPVGASADISFATGEFDRLQLVGGYFAGDLPYGDDSRIGAAQLAWHWHEGAPASTSVLVSYLDFGDLEHLVLQGQSRTNRRIAGTNRLVSDYRLLDVQLVGRAQVADLPLEVRLDVARNLGGRPAQRGARQCAARRQPPRARLGDRHCRAAHPARRGHGGVQLGRLVVSQLGAWRDAVAGLRFQRHLERPPGRVPRTSRWGRRSDRSRAAGHLRPLVARLPVLN